MNNKSTVGSSYLHDNGIPEAYKREIIDALPESVLIAGYLESRIIVVDGKQLLPNTSQAIKNNSPGGFNWGYNGSAPAQLALAILLKYLPQEYALNLYQSFEENVIAVWPHDDISITLNLREAIQKILNNE